MNKGLYVHIPFCIRKCKYCDFISFTSCEYEAYVDALCKELDMYKGEKIDTVFIGGGTPTILPLNLIEKLFVHINNTFSLSNDTEWTVEANPKTVDSEKLNMMRSLGVNRISLGVQSFNDAELTRIGRVHTAKEAKETISLIARYFDNFNIDIISALPEQSQESFLRTLDIATSFDPTHISCYSLILEEGTPLFDEHRIKPLNIPDEETEREMYQDAVMLLDSKGYKQYEISNFAKDGYECRHNLKYWNTSDYIGVGIAAHGLLKGVRYENTSDLKSYINGDFCCEKTVLTEEDKIAEYIIMTLRLRSGLNTNEFRNRFNKDFYSEYKMQIERFISLGLLEKTVSGFRLTDEGISLSNTVLCEFV